MKNVNKKYFLSLFCFGFFKKIGNYGANLIKIHLSKILRIDHKNAVKLQIRIKLETDSFVNTSSDLIASNCGFKNFFGNYYCITLPHPFVWRKNQGDFWGANSLPFLISILNATTRMETIFTR